MSARNDELVRSSFEAFLRGDWDELSAVMDPDVQWLWYEPGDWDCHGRRKVLATLFERQREGVVTGLDAVVVGQPWLARTAGRPTPHGADQADIPARQASG